MNKKQFLHASIPFDICMYKEGKTPLRLHCGNYDTLVDNEKRIAIVHTISDLTKPITHNGETFVPINILAKIGNFAVCEKHTLSTIKDIESGFSPFCFIQKLIEWHFNLMDENEPFIDVNALSENPYK